MFIKIPVKKDTKEIEKDITEEEVKGLVEGASSIIQEERIKQAKKAKALQQNEVIKKAGTLIEPEESGLADSAPEITEEEVIESFNLFVDFFLMLFNPSLVKRGIARIESEELQPLLEAGASLASPKLAEAGESLVQKIEGIAWLKKLFDFVKALYEIIQPRYVSIKKYLKEKKKKGA